MPGRSRSSIGTPCRAERRGKLEAVAATVDGVNFARDLVNEPPNVLYPEEFARRCEALRQLGVEVEILDKARLEAIGMRTLLAVNQGSVREPRVVIMRWNGAAEKDAAPLAFVGKGVCFDTGGISIKPGGGMEDMKGRHGRGGRGHRAHACARGAQGQGQCGRRDRPRREHARRRGPASRRYRDLPCPDRPSRSSTPTRRVVSCSPTCIWHVRETFKPRFVIDLATLTGSHHRGARPGACRPLLQQ